MSKIVLPARKFAVAKFDIAPVGIPMEQIAKPKRTQKKRRVPLSQRAVLTPQEFAARFGRQKVWAYRQVYAGRVKAITGFGNMMIPRSELDRILESAREFDSAGGVQ
jgi:hypothetical protein